MEGLPKQPTKEGGKLVHELANENGTKDADTSNKNPQQVKEVSPDELKDPEEKNDAETYEKAPSRWLTLRSLAKKLNVSEKLARKISETYRAGNSDGFKKYKNPVNGEIFDYHSPELVQVIEKDRANRPIPPKDWVTCTMLAKNLGQRTSIVYTVAEKFKDKYPDWFKSYFDKDNREHVFYSPELVSLLSAQDELKFGKAPKGWLTKKTLAKKLSLSSREAISTIAETYKSKHSDWIKKYKPAKNKTCEHYSPELVRIIAKEISEREFAPAGWITSHALGDELSLQGLKVKLRKVRKYAEKYRADHSEWFKFYKNANGFYEHYSPELVKLITTDRMNEQFAPENWKVRDKIAKELGISWLDVKEISDKYRKDNSEWFKDYKIANGTLLEHFSPELVKIIAKEISAIKVQEETERKAFEQTVSLRRGYENFSKEVAEGKTLESQEFRKLLATFGSARLFDIFYKYRPEFTNIPVDYVKGVLAKYLGDFLTIQSQFKIQDLGPALRYLSEQTFQDALFEVVKESCLTYHHAEKFRNRDADDGQIIAEYIRQTRADTDEYNSPELVTVIDRVESHYQSLFADFKKPDRIVDTLDAGRQFPDVNQLVNIKELADKRRVLNADQMGTGKSGSAILAKEHLGIKCALVVPPSNVLATWQAYLSDRVSETGEQIGYFKQGQAPRVLVVDSVEALKGTNPAPTSFDYVLISQEKMNARYVAELQKCGFDMLILDETHKLKNLVGGKRAKAVVDLAKTIDGEEKYLALLSGTPVPNKVEDVAMVLKLLYPERFDTMKEKDLVAAIIHGDLVDLRSLLIPRMQMKTLRESIEMPELREEVLPTTLSGKEQEIYEILLDDDELTADEKIRIFRKYVMNPAAVDPTPDIESSKIGDVADHLREVFQTKRRVVMFVNGYVEGMIRGANTIIEKCGLPEDIRVRVIEGNAAPSERQEIQRELERTNEKILLLVSGQTADVGVDFSAAEHVLFYNEPWTEYAKQQQTARVYRPGLKSDLTVTTSVVEKTIEEGIQEYILLKYNAIQKLLKGIPITEIEQDILRKSEKQETQDIEGNVALAKEWLSSPQNRLYRFFGMTKEIGEQNFHKFLLEHGEEYAECYLDMGSRGFQANTGRVAGALIDRFSKEKGQDPRAITILDIASGPEMLKTHIGDAYKDRVVSLDINPLHFQNKGERRMVGSFLKLPVQDKTIDYANLSLAWHYTRFIPRRNEYERLSVLSEMNRALKIGGRVIINLIHSLELKDAAKFKRVATAAGFKLVDGYSGEITSGAHYRSECIVVEKQSDAPTSLEELIKQIGPENMDGAKFRERSASSLKNGRRIVNKFALNGREFPISFNASDNEMFQEEQSILAEGRELQERYGSIKAIPREEISNRSFLRIFNGKSYRLLKKSDRMGGFVDVR